MKKGIVIKKIVCSEKKDVLCGEIEGMGDEI